LKYLQVCDFKLLSSDIFFVRGCCVSLVERLFVVKAWGLVFDMDTKKLHFLNPGLQVKSLIIEGAEKLIDLTLLFRMRR
jgi:hypothetical protein